MEKNATVKTVVKAEPPPHAAVITVDLDHETLNCPRCHHPLVPLVFQCAAGHVVCSTCHGDLPDKDRCVSCFVKTGYTRAASSPRPTVAAWPSSASSDMPASLDPMAAPSPMCEKAEHQKTCLGYSRIKVVELVRRMGPCGSAGGYSNELNMYGGERVVEVVIQHWDAVDAIRVLYERYGDKASEAWTGTWGGQDGKHSTFRLEPDEYLTSVEGHYSGFNGPVIIRSIKFVSNLRTYGPYGKYDGVPFALHAGVGGRIIGLHARCGQFLDSIGTYVQME